RVDRRAGGARALSAWRGAPMRLDVDGDGRDEVLAKVDGSLAVVDPTMDWGVLAPDGGGGLPLLALGGGGVEGAPARPATVGWFDAHRDVAGAVSIATIERGSVGRLHVDTVSTLFGDAT